MMYAVSELCIEITIYPRGGKNKPEEILAFSQPKNFSSYIYYIHKFEFWHILKFKNSQVAKLNFWENLLL